MASMKVRVARAGVLYVVRNPTTRVSRFAIRFVAKRVRRAAVARVEPVTAHPSRLVAVGGVAIVAGGLILWARRSTDAAASPAVHVPPVGAPMPAAEPTPVPGPAGAAVETVATPLASDDAALAARVERELFAGSPALGVSVEVAAGVVTLRGPVSDEDAAVRIVRDAEAIEGVRAVQSELEPTSS